jgi:hypothetical protein
MPKQSLRPSPFGVNALGTWKDTIPLVLTLTAIESYAKHPDESVPFTMNVVVVSSVATPQVEFDSIPQVCIDQPSFIFNEAKEITGASGQGCINY